jgi:hypothetical protein
LNKIAVFQSQTELDKVLPLPSNTKIGIPVQSNDGRVAICHAFTEGDLKVDLVGGDTVTMYNLAAGAWHPIQAKRVYATGTAATYILGAY